jgi:hypothetical protein
MRMQDSKKQLASVLLSHDDSGQSGSSQGALEVCYLSIVSIRANVLIETAIATLRRISKRMHRAGFLDTVGMRERVSIYSAYFV